MANLIKVAITHSIQTLYSRGWSKRRIARELGLDRETVARYIRIGRERKSNPAISTAGSPDSKPAIPAISTTGSPDPKPAISTAGKPGRPSQCNPFRENIEQKIQAGLSAQRIYQDLVVENGYTGSYESVKRCVRGIREGHPERIYRMECLPGEEAQVDFGRGAPIVGENGHRSRPPFLRVTLSYSRKSYSECIPRQTTEGFIRCIENAFRSFCGVPRTLCIDNLKAAVTKADWYDPDLNPKIDEFARHYGTAVLPTRPYTPQHKGKVEGGVKYVKNNALKGREFVTMEAENAYLRHWEETVADLRIHGTTRTQVKKLFEEHEKRALLPLPPMLFPCFEEGQRTVHRDSYVEVARSYYEVPEEYIGRKVWVRWDSRLVHIYNQRFEKITVFARVPRGKFSSCLGLGGRRGSVARNADYWLERTGLIGEQCGKWGMAVLLNRGPLAIRVLQGLVALTRRHSAKCIEEACALALSHGAYRLRDVRHLIKIPTEQDNFEFTQTHPLIRDMAEYGTVIRNLAELRKEVVPA